jgi:hypothetical protein
MSENQLAAYFERLWENGPRGYIPEPIGPDNWEPWQGIKEGEQ